MPLLLFPLQPLCINDRLRRFDCHCLNTEGEPQMIVEAGLAVYETLGAPWWSDPGCCLLSTSSLWNISDERAILETPAACWDARRLVGSGGGATKLELKRKPTGLIEFSFKRTSLLLLKWNLLSYALSAWMCMTSRSILGWWGLAWCGLPCYLMLC